MSSKKATSFARDAAKLSGAAAVSQALAAFLGFFVFMRLFGTASFGVLHAYTAVITIFGTVACLRYEMALVLPEKDEDAASLFWACLGLVGVVTGISIVVVYLLGDALSHIPPLDSLKTGSWAYWSSKSLKKYEKAGPFLWLVPPGVFLFGAYLALRFWSTRKSDFGVIAVAQLANTASRETSKLGLGGLLRWSRGAAAPRTSWLGHGALIWSELVSYVVTVVFLGRRIWREDGAILRKGLNLRRIFAMMNRYRKFPLVNSWAAFMNVLSRRVPNLVLYGVFGAGVTGLFGQALSLIEQPMSMVSEAVRKVFLKHSADECIERGAPTKSVEMSFGALLSIGLGPFAILSLLAPYLFAIPGGDWVMAGVFMRWMSPWLLVVFITSPLMPVTSVMERQEIGLVLQIMKLFLRIVALVLGCLVFRDALVTVKLLSVFGILGQGLMLFWIMHLSRVHMWTAIARESATILSTLGFALLFLLLRAILGSGVWVAVGSSVVFGCLYVGLLVRRFNVTFDKIASLGRRGR